MIFREIMIASFSERSPTKMTLPDRKMSEVDFGLLRRMMTALKRRGLYSELPHLAAMPCKQMD